MRLNGLAGFEQRVDRRLEGGGRIRLQPLAKAQELFRTVRQPGNALQGMRNDAQRLVLLPEQQDLRLGADERVGGGEAALEAADLGDGAARVALGAHHGQPDDGAGEQHEAADQRGGGDRRRRNHRCREVAARGDAAGHDEHARKARRDESDELTRFSCRSSIHG